MQNEQLWQRIQAFQLDEPNIALPFSKRLARECGWSKYYTFRAIEEYKRFMYLVCISPKPITPPEAVDFVWHLHLLYTKSYWEKFCAETLEKRIHHTPTQGGNAEGEKFIEYYERTLARYEANFGMKPPEDIWLPTEARFGGAQWQWVDTKEWWLMPKNAKVVLAKIKTTMNEMYQNIFQIIP